MKKEKLTIRDIFKPVNDFLVITKVKQEGAITIVSTNKGETNENEVYEVLAVGPNVAPAIGVQEGDYIFLMGMTRCPIIDFISDDHLLVRAHQIVGIIAKNYKEAEKEVKDIGVKTIEIISSMNGLKN